MPGKRGRQPKKSGGRATPKGTQPSGHVSAHVRSIFAHAAEAIDDDPIDAESFASSFQQVFRPQGTPPQSLATPEEVLREALRIGGLVGLFVTRSIRVFGPQEARARADSVYEKLAAKSPPPRWLAEMGNVTVGEVAVLRDQYGDGFGVYLEYEDALAAVRSVGVYIDTNMGGIAKDVIDGPPLAMVRELAAAEPQIEISSMDPAEARARVETAFGELDRMGDPDLSDDLFDLRALAEQRFLLLPGGGSVPDDPIELSDEEREALIETFVNSAHFAGLPETAREISETICEFADFSDGNPLRWSPVVVEIFLVDWLPREVIADDEFFRDIPIVLRSWIRFAGDRRGLDDGLIEETVQSIDQWLDEYHELIAKPAARAAVQSFVDEYSADLADVDHDLDRAEEGLLAQWGAFEAQLVDVMKSSLTSLRNVAQPTDLVAASANAVREGVRVGASPFIEAAALTDFDPDELDGVDDFGLVCSIATACELEGAGALNHTDLLRVIVTLATEGVGAQASAETLAQLIDVDEPGDLDLVLTALGVFVTLWQAIGLVDASTRLTPLGQWLLPRAFSRTWGGDFDA